MCVVLCYTPIVPLQEQALANPNAFFSSHPLPRQEAEVWVCTEGSPILLVLEFCFNVRNLGPRTLS